MSEMGCGDSVSGTLAYMPARPRASLGFWVVSALWWEQLLAGVLTVQSSVPRAPSWSG